MTRKPNIFASSAPRDTRGTVLNAFMVALIVFTASMGWIVLSVQYGVTVSPVAVAVALISGLVGVVLVFLAAVL